MKFMWKKNDFQIHLGPKGSTEWPEVDPLLRVTLMLDAVCNNMLQTCFFAAKLHILQAENPRMSYPKGIEN
jgi:hypothetical protein